MTGRVLDISLTVRSGMPVWPGDPPVELERVATLAADGANVSRLACGVHMGTHIDAPCHYLDQADGVEAIDPLRLIGAARVVPIEGDGHVDAAGLARAAAQGLLPEGTRRVLLRTHNSFRRAAGQDDLIPEFVALTVDGAAWLAARGVWLVGIDGPSIAPWDDLAHTHVGLLEAGVVIVEGLDLTAVGAGEYTLVCLPLRLEGSDGAPARAMLIAP